MAWLLRRGEVLASVELAQTPITWARSASAAVEHDTVLISRPAFVAHSVGASVPLDIAHLDANLTVIAVSHLAPLRIALPRRGCRAILRARSDAFGRWSLRVGDELEIKG